MHKDIFYKIVNERVTELIDESDKLLEHQSGKDVRKSQALDRNIVFSIIETITATFMKTKSSEEALLAGKTQGLSLYLSKADENSELKRYQSSSYWDKVLNQFLSGDYGSEKQKALLISSLDIRA